MNQIEQLTLSVLNSFNKRSYLLPEQPVVDIAFIASTANESALMMASAQFPTYHEMQIRMEGIGIEHMRNPMRLRGNTRALVFVAQNVYEKFCANKELYQVLVNSLMTSSQITRREVSTLIVPMVIDFKSRPQHKIQKYFRQEERDEAQTV